MIRLITCFTAILFFQLSRAAAPVDQREKKIITITVNQYSQVFMGRDTLTIADLSKELEERLWRNFLGTGKTYDAIKLNFTEGVSQPIRLATIAAIKTAQKAVLKNISLEKQENVYEALAPDKQEKLKKKISCSFPAILERIFKP